MTRFLDNLILVGALQGFVVGLLVVMNSRTTYAGRILGFLLLIMALACLKIYLMNTDALANPVGLLIDAFVPFMIIMPVGPLIYFYCRSETDRTFRIKANHRIHFFPVAIDLLQHVAAIVFALFVLVGWVHQNENRFGIWFDTYNQYADIPRWASMTTYLVFSFRHLSSYRQPGASADQAHNNHSWLREFLWVFLAFDLVWLCYLIPYVTPGWTDQLLATLDWYPLYLPLVLLIYWLGIRSLLLNRHELVRKKGSPLTLPPEQIAEASRLLQKAMEEDKLYQDPELSLPRLAGHLKISAKVLSVVIRQISGMSFTEYINHFRVEQIKMRLKSPDSKRFTITALAYQSGFNSQPTFQRAFKSLTGMTPSEFMVKNNDGLSKTD
ncbi:MAG: helix-turn-helix transcriptional regulator [Cyclobacteriaceae bacterium]|nr:helix-turn-helix transcriptional regulator [Cyclobacteriaceae bacterium]